MRVLVIGGTGTIGSAVVQAFRDLGDDVIVATRNSTPSVDITDSLTIQELFGKLGKIDTLISTAGHVPSVSLRDAKITDFATGFASKLGGQLAAVLTGLPYLTPGASCTITTGILGQHAIAGSVITATVNNALEGFVRRASLELTDGIRLNCVNPTIVLEPGQQNTAFRGFHSVTPQEVAQAYIRSAYGVETGQIFRVW